MIGDEFIGIDQGAELFGEVCCAMQVSAFQDDDELFAANSVQAVRYADTQIDDLRHPFEYLVTYRVTMDVIDLLEVIEIK